MKTLKYFSFIILLITASEIYPQQKNIFIFDPNGVSGSFQYSLSQLTDDSVFVADTIDESVLNYDALFLFINYPFELTEDEGNILINYVDSSKPAYLYSDLGGELDSVAFWNHIGINGMAWLATLVMVSSVNGIDTAFTHDVIIDTSFVSGSIPVVFGNIEPVLIGMAEPIDIYTTYISPFNNLKVIIDLYNLIDDEGFLRRVLEYFELIPIQPAIIEFHPPVDTGLIFSGCCASELICRNLVSTTVHDSISIEPENFTQFYYLDSLGHQISIDNFYFIVDDSSDEFEYEIWYYPEYSTTPVLINFDSSFQADGHNFDLQLKVKKNGLIRDSFLQPFFADFGLSVDNEGNSPEKFHLLQNYPNPFNPSTKIKFNIPESGLVTLKVYDVLGNEIASLINEEKPAGKYEVEFNASNLPSGIYFYQIKADLFLETKKMILLK